MKPTSDVRNESFNVEPTAKVDIVVELELSRETTTRSHRKRAATITGLTVTVLYTALSLFCWQHLVAAGVTTHMYRADVGDVGQRVWFMAWLPFAIAHHTNPFVSTYMFAPHGINVLANASVLFEAFLLSPITELSSPITSVNIASIAAPVVSALSLYFVSPPVRDAPISGVRRRTHLRLFACAVAVQWSCRFQPNLDVLPASGSVSHRPNLLPADRSPSATRSSPGSAHRRPVLLRSRDTS